MSLQKLGTRVLILRAERVRFSLRREAEAGAAVCKAGPESLTVAGLLHQLDFGLQHIQHR